METITFVGKAVKAGKNADGSDRLAVFFNRELQEKYEIKPGTYMKITAEEVV